MNQRFIRRTIVRLFVLGLFIFVGSGCTDNCDNKNYRCHDNVLQSCRSDEDRPDGFWDDKVDCSDYGATCRSFHNTDLMRETYEEFMSPPPDSPVQCVYDDAEICLDADLGASFCVEEGESIATCGMDEGELLPVITQFHNEYANVQFCVEDALGNGVYSYFDEPCEAGQHRCYSEFEALRCENNVWRVFEKCGAITTCKVLLAADEVPDPTMVPDSGTGWVAEVDGSYEISRLVGCVSGPCSNERESDCINGSVMLCRDGYYREPDHGAEFCNE